MSGKRFEDIYDAETIRMIDGWSPARGPVDTVARWRRGAAAGALTSALVSGVREALEDEADAPVVEVEALPRPHRLEPVTLYYVPGEPRASVAIVRRWLL